MSDTIREQVEESIQKRNLERLQELTIFVLLLQAIWFAVVWFDSAELSRPFILVPPLEWIDASSIALGYNIVKSIIGVVVLISIVVYFWRARNIPLFQVLFIEREEEQSESSKDRKKVQRQIDKKLFFTSFLIPVGISIGLAFTAISYSLYPGHWWSPVHTLWWSLLYTPLSWYPLIVVACSCILLYFAYRIKPAYIERSVPALLIITTLISTGTAIYAISNHALVYFLKEIQGMPPVTTSAGPIFPLLDFFLFSTRITFLACFIILAYLIYRFSAEDREVYTFAKEKQLRGLIEEGMWILPRRVRVGDSHSMSLYLKLSDDFANRACSGNCSYESGDYLEAELHATELKVDTDMRRLKICETSPLRITNWNCGFPTAGRHTINIMINVVKQKDNSRDIIFAQQHDVKVESLLTASIAPAIAIIMPVLVALVQAFLKIS